MMGPKITELKSRRGSFPLFASQFDDVVCKRLEKWKDDRNELMHAMADATISIADIDDAAKKLAEDGAKLVREYCALCRRVKKKPLL